MKLIGNSNTVCLSLSVKFTQRLGDPVGAFRCFRTRSTHQPAEYLLVGGCFALVGAGWALVGRWLGAGWALVGRWLAGALRWLAGALRWLAGALRWLAGALRWLAGAFANRKAKAPTNQQIFCWLAGASGHFKSQKHPPELRALGPKPPTSG